MGVRTGHEGVEEVGMLVEIGITAGVVEPSGTSPSGRYAFADEPLNFGRPGWKTSGKVRG